jgi:hypothetical protein
MSKPNHRRDPLDSDLLSREGPWYSPRSRDYISPGLTENPETIPYPQPPRPAHRIPQGPGRHRRPKSKPVRKLRPQYVVASVFTAMLAIPVLWVAANLARHPEETSPIVYTHTAYLPVHFGYKDEVMNGCVVVESTGGIKFKAWATSVPCSAPEQADQSQTSPG